MSAVDAAGQARGGPMSASTEELAEALSSSPYPFSIFRSVRGPGGQVTELLYTFLNEAAARLYGRPVEAALGHGLCELFPSVREQGIWDTLLQVIDSGSPKSFEVPWFRENGVEGSFRLTACPFRDGLLVSAADITEQRRAERALAETSLRYKMLAENASDVVVLTGPDGRITWVSPAVTRRLGWASEDLLGTRLVELVHRDDAAATADARAQVYSGEEVTAPPGGFLMRFRTKSGDYVWMSGLATPVKDESGAYVGVVSGLRNVDELVHAREAAQMDQAAIRATVDSLLDPHILLEAVRDESGQISDFVYVDANPAACAYNRMDHKELIGARLLDLLPGHATAGLLEQYRQVVETGEPLVQDDIVYAQELLGGVERHYDARASRVGDGISYTWRDVTERFEAAQRLAESEEHYRLLAENASDVVMRLSPAWRYEWVSGSVVGLLGWEPPDLVGRPIDEFVHPDDRARFRQVADTAPGTAMSVEFRFRRADETYRWVVCRTRLKVDEDGAPVAVVGGLVDVEDRKAAEAKEQDRLRELEQFQKLTVGRELKMIELKKEIEYLRKLAASAAAGDAETTAVTDRRRDQPRRGQPR